MKHDLMLQRNPSGRQALQIRPVSIEVGVNRYAEGSALIKSGNTHVLCTASFDENVPPWLAGKGRGWVTAEYSMLPRSTHTRSKRDREKVSGRTQEIQRLIARALRSVVDLKGLGERQLIIDCDVLQADGGTRTASITGGCVALVLALGKLHKEGRIPAKNLTDVWTDTVAAISIGLKSGSVLTDLDYDEDSSCDVDMNFVVTGKGQFVEVQGTAEKSAFGKVELDQMTNAAMNAAEELRTIQLTALKAAGVSR
jgi:ribonuclease PH